MTSFILDNAVVLIGAVYLLYNLHLVYLKYFRGETNTEKYDLLANYIELEIIRNKRKKC